MFLKQYLSYLIAYSLQVCAAFKFSFDKTKNDLIFICSILLLRKMVKEGLCLLSFIKYINIFFKLINAF